MQNPEACMQFTDSERRCILVSTDGHKTQKLTAFADSFDAYSKKAFVVDVRGLFGLTGQN
jgi:hypothetical protein